MCYVLIIQIGPLLDLPVGRHCLIHALFYIFLIVNKTPEKSKANNVLFPYPVCGSQPQAHKQE